MSELDRTHVDRFEGCLLGLALGDAMGAPFEGGVLERALWRLVGRTWKGEMRWTDDTQMSLDLAESLLERHAVDPDDLAVRFARGYRWSRGYGRGAAKLLKQISMGADWRSANRSVFPDGSYGNGGAMRAPVIGLFHSAELEQLTAAARRSAAVTHAHPLGMEGAVLMAWATAGAVLGRDPREVLHTAAEPCTLEPFTTRLEIARAWLEADETPSPERVRQELGNGIQAARSCVTAVYVGLRHMHDPFLDLQRFVGAVGGDVDTIGAMAGAIWGAANGVSRLPEPHLSRLEQRDRVASAARRLQARQAG